MTSRSSEPKARRRKPPGFSMFAPDCRHRAPSPGCRSYALGAGRCCGRWDRGSRPHRGPILEFANARDNPCVQRQASRPSRSEWQRDSGNGIAGASSSDRRNPSRSHGLTLVPFPAFQGQPRWGPLPIACGRSVFACAMTPAVPKTLRRPSSGEWSPPKTGAGT
jgi:hypothetical protein